MSKFDTIFPPEHSFEHVVDEDFLYVEDGALLTS